MQFNPPGSGCSVHFGNGLTSAPPGAAQNLLVVSDIERARDELVGRAVDADLFHDAGGGCNRFDPTVRPSGPDPERRAHASFAEFSDPAATSGTCRRSRRSSPAASTPPRTTFSTTHDLADAMRRASVAHGEHEKRIGEADPNWPEWYAAYMVAEQSGAELPQCATTT
jgi:hypothetical protein